MFKRLFWLAVGIGLGFGLAVLFARAVRRTADRLTPESIAGRLADGMRDLGHDIREAVRDGREAMAEREAELRADIESGTARLAPGRSGGNGRRGADPEQQLT